MKGEEFKHTNCMNLKEWKQFVKNYDNWKMSNNTPIKDFLIRMNEKDFFYLIDDSFNWTNTDEGYEYWKEIANRKIEKIY